MSVTGHSNFPLPGGEREDHWNSAIPITRGTTRNISRVMISVATRSRVRPARVMERTRTSPVPYTIVFGAVATGSMNPDDAASTAGIIRA